MTSTLPAAAIADEVNRLLADNDTLIITAPPGAGKSTLLPLTMLETVEGKIIVLEPRRLAARQIAERMADMLGERVGQTVGYRVRFDTKISPATRIEVITEGILVRMLRDDNELRGVSIVIFDEFHERSLFTDISLALALECRNILRPDLKIVLMSATIDTNELSERFNAPVVACQGRMFPVQTIYSGTHILIGSARETAELVAHYVRIAHKDAQGDILVFLPGEAEIRICNELLAEAFENTIICPLYGQLSPSQQREAILPNASGMRKIVLATSIAETSLTIQGIHVVVDSGLCRKQVFNPVTAMSGLQTVAVSLDMADQRRGRAGRLTDGICYRLWSKQDEATMLPQRKPEILEADLSQTVLDLSAWGEANPTAVDWLTPPPAQSLRKAKELLVALRAIDESGRITEHGRKIAALPCHPRIAQMLASAKTNSHKALATDIAALLDERDPLSNNEGVDINLRIEALRRSRTTRRFERIERIAQQYRRLLQVEVDNSAPDCYASGMLIAAAFPERIACAHQGSNALFRLSNSTMASMAHTDSLAQEPWIAIASLDGRDRQAKIFLAAPLDPTDLKDYMVEVENVRWDSQADMIVAQKEKRIGSLVLEAKPIANVPRELLDKAIVDAIAREGAHLLDMNDEVAQLQCRISSLAAWHPDEPWPNVSSENLYATAGQWFAPFLANAKSAADIKKISVAAALKASLPYELQVKLDRCAPEKIGVPSGSMIKLSYQPNGQPPVLAVRLQECFGLAETPAVDDGRRRVVMHLLSPGFKPVQITSDLRSFWNNAYFDVRKELRARYPKHVWPDDPWNEEPTKKHRKKF